MLSVVRGEGIGSLSVVSSIISRVSKVSSPVAHSPAWSSPTASLFGVSSVVGAKCTPTSLCGSTELSSSVFLPYATNTILH